VSPILVRPVREQFEHDRVIRALQGRYKRKYEVAINPGAEQNEPVGIGNHAMYPDLVLFSQDRGRKLQGTVEVETGESINTLEAMAEWAQFGRLRAPFFLYVPPHAVDTVRRLCAEYQVTVAEIWTYHTAIDQVRFTMVHRAPDVPAPVSKARGADKEKAPKAAPSGPVTPAAAATPGKANGPKPAGKGSEKATRHTRAAAKKRPAAKSVKRPAAKAKATKSGKKTAVKQSSKAVRRR
jgi:hypothetical protein